MRRERQDAIGDSMLVENAGAARRFDVKGYRLYEKGPREGYVRAHSRPATPASPTGVF